MSPNRREASPATAAAGGCPASSITRISNRPAFFWAASARRQRASSSGRPQVAMTTDTPMPVSGAVFLQAEATDHQSIQRGGPETFQSVAGSADNRLPAGVEGGVDQHRDSGP